MNAAENTYFGMLTLREASAKLCVAQSSLAARIAMLPEGLGCDSESESLRRHTSILSGSRCVARSGDE